jgi:uncharacterized protein YhfF
VPTDPSIESVLAQLRARGVPVPPGRVRIDRYGDSETLSAELLALIRSGRKRAGTSLLRAMEAEGQPLPRPGDIEVVLNFSGEPVLVTRIVRAEVVPFSDVSAEYAAIEGEGDGSLDYWRKAHWAFFTRECARLHLELSEDMPVVCSVIEVVGEVPDYSVT